MRRRELNAELDKLRAWKSDAMQVLARWDEVADKVPSSDMKLGEYRSTSVGRYIDKLRGELAVLIARQR